MGLAKRLIHQGARCFGMDVYDMKKYRLEKMEPDPVPLPPEPIQALEEDKVAAFLKAVEARGFRPRRVLDVGANRGHWSSQLIEAVGPCEIVMVEPQEHMSVYLEPFLEANPGTRWVKAGAAGTCGERTFHVLDDTYSSSFLEKQGADGLVVDTRTVPVVTLDSLYPEGSVLPDTVKLDIEGMELEVMRGSPRVMGACEMLFVEWGLFPARKGQPSILELHAACEDMGLALYDFTMFLRRPYDHALCLVEAVYVREGSDLRVNRYV